MAQSLEIPDGGKAEEVYKAFDNSLGVSGWATPGRPMSVVERRDPEAPLWWTGDEDASQSFLHSQGVMLDG
jgi:hypothetical protein